MAFNTRTAMTQNHFLTHFHSDHYGGITKAWNSGTIYCSVATANLVNQQLGIDRKWLHPLPMLTPVVIESRGKPVTVTPLDANHCPGAVILFEIGSNKSKKHILHVEISVEPRVYDDAGATATFCSWRASLDEIFFDTYCDPKYTFAFAKGSN
jgi:DNA cross-link repair 1A protein